MRRKGGGNGSDVNRVRLFIKRGPSFSSCGSLKLQCTFKMSLELLKGFSWFLRCQLPVVQALTFPKSWVFFRGSACGSCNLTPLITHQQRHPGSRCRCFPLVRLHLGEVVDCDLWLSLQLILVYLFTFIHDIFSVFIWKNLLIVVSQKSKCAARIVQDQSVCAVGRWGLIPREECCGLFVAQFAFQEGEDLVGDFLCLFLRKD